MTGSEPIRVALAGLGRSGWRNHLLHLAAMSDRYRIVAVTDPDEARRQEAVQRTGCRAYAQLAQLLDDREVELVTIATPSHLHPEQVEQALAAGKHVVCEKPMANSLAAADGMIAAAQRAGRVLTAFQNRRYSADFRQVRAVIDSGVLGRLVQIRIALHTYGRRWDWQTLRRFHGGELNNVASHFVDQALVLMGECDLRVACWTDRALTCGDTEDHVKVCLSAPGRPLVEVEVSYACSLPQDRWLVMGTHGTLAGNAGELRWQVSNLDQLPPRTPDPAPTPDRSYNDEDYQWTPSSWKRPADEPSESVHFYRDLHDALRAGRQPPVSPQSVRRQIAVLDECRRQADLAPAPALV
jgi:predicted dehydrogenase